MSDADKNKIWIKVHIGPLTLLGACRDYVVIDSDDAKMPAAEVIKRIDQAVEAGKTLHLEPVMELQAPLQQVRQQVPGGAERVGVARAPLPMPYGFTTGRTHLRVLRPDAYTFLDEMSDDDQKVYRSFIETVLKAELDERAARAGITLASSLPGVGRG